MSYSVWKQCKSKRRYRDEHTVNFYRKKCQRARGQELAYYLCPICNGFHLTSNILGYCDNEVRLTRSEGCF